MKLRTFFALIILALAATFVQGQVTNKEVVKVTTDITGASTCAVGKIYYNATSLVNWERNNAGVCAAITSGGTPGTVASVSVVSANGLSGTVATATTTPAITLNITALDAAKIADGTVSSAEFQFLNTVTSNVQTQIDGKQASLGFTPENSANKDAASGYAGLDSGSLLKAAEFPAFTGDATKPSGSVVTTVVKVNGNTPGGTCTNQFARSIDSSGRPTCATISLTADLGASTVGANLFGATNPSAISFPKIAVDNSVSFRTPSQVLSDIGAQPLDSDLSTIAGLTATTDNFMVSVSSAWASRTVAQVKATLSLDNLTNDAQTKAAVVPNTAPTAGQLLIGNAGGTAYAPLSFSQDCTVASTGVVTCLKTNNVSFGTAATQNTGTSGATIPVLNAANSFSGVQTFGAALIIPSDSVTDNGSTIATDASLGNNFRVSALTANVTLSNPTNSADGQRVVWEVIQNGSAAKTLAFDTNFKFGAEITACTISTTLSSHNFLTATYNSTTTKWYVVGCLTGY